MNTKMKGKKDKKLIRSIGIYSKLNSISHIDHSLPALISIITTGAFQNQISVAVDEKK